MTEAPRSEKSTGKTRRRRARDDAGVADAGRPGRELDAELNRIAKDLQRIDAGFRAPGVTSTQRRKDLREQLKGTAAEIRRATVAARAESARAMGSSPNGKSGQASGSPGGGRISAVRADQLSKLKGELRRLRQELNALAPAQAAIKGEQTAPDRPTTATTAGEAKRQPREPEATGDSEAAVPAIVSGAEPAAVAGTKASRRPLARMAGAVALVVAAAVAGLLLGRSTGDDATSSQPAIASAAASQNGDYERAVGGQLEELAGARASALEQLRHAESPAAQAEAGRDLAAAHRLAADAIAATATPAALKTVKHRLVDGLTGLAHGYRKLARAAADQNAGAYEEGRRAVKRAEGDLGHGLSRIQEVQG